MTLKHYAFAAVAAFAFVSLTACSIEATPEEQGEYSSAQKGENGKKPGSNGGTTSDDGKTPDGKDPVKAPPPKDPSGGGTVPGKEPTKDPGTGTDPGSKDPVKDPPKEPSEPEEKDPVPPKK